MKGKELLEETKKDIDDANKSFVKKRIEKQLQCLEKAKRQYEYELKHFNDLLEQSVEEIARSERWAGERD